jgi:DNA-binding PadR family transcriptional regulator
VGSLIDYAVLSLLIERPSYGYELYERFERRFGEFLPTSRSNLYDALKRLEREGCIERASQGGSRGRPRINHRPTEEGLEASWSWLADCLQDDPRRLELFSRLASVGVRNMEDMQKVLDRFEEQSTREARQVELPNPDPASIDPLSDLLWEMLIEQRRRIVAAQLEWVPHARSRVRAWAEGGPAGEDTG